MKVVLLLGALLVCSAEQTGYIPCSCTTQGAILVQLAEDYNATLLSVEATIDPAKDATVGVSIENADEPENDSVCVCKRMKKPQIPVRCTKRGLLHGNCNDRDEFRKKGLEIAPEPLVPTLYPDEVPQPASGKVFQDAEVEKTAAKNLAVEDQSVVGKTNLQHSFKKHVLLSTKDLVLPSDTARQTEKPTEAPAVASAPVAAPTVAEVPAVVPAPVAPETPTAQHPKVLVAAKTVSLEDLARLEEKRTAKAHPAIRAPALPATPAVESNENAGGVTVDVPPELKTEAAKQPTAPVSVEAPKDEAATVAVVPPSSSSPQAADVSAPVTATEPLADAPQATVKSEEINGDNGGSKATASASVEQLSQRLESQTRETDQLKRHIDELEAELKAIVAATRK